MTSQDVDFIPVNQIHEPDLQWGKVFSEAITSWGPSGSLLGRNYLHYQSPEILLAQSLNPSMKKSNSLMMGLSLLVLT